MASSNDPLPDSSAEIRFRYCPRCGEVILPGSVCDFCQPADRRIRFIPLPDDDPGEDDYLADHEWDDAVRVYEDSPD